MPVYNMPTGTIVPHASPETPINWVACDGAAYDGTSSKYSALYSVIGTTYGGTGQSSFNVPSLGSRVPVGPKASAEVAITNPSFDANTAGWTASGSTITRDTSVYHSAPASGRWDNTGASNNLDFGDSIQCALTGTFVAGVSYTLTWKMRASSGAWLYAYFGDLASATGNYQFRDYVNGFTAGVWNTYTVSWTPTTNTNGATFSLSDRSSFFGLASYYWLDSLTVTSTEGDGGIGTWYGSTSHLLTADQTGLKSHNHNTSQPLISDGAGGFYYGHNHGGNVGGSHRHLIYIKNVTYDNKNANSTTTVYTGSNNVTLSLTYNDWGVYSQNTGSSNISATIGQNGAANASNAHTNLQPEIALNYIIKL